MAAGTSFGKRCFFGKTQEALECAYTTRESTLALCDRNKPMLIVFIYFGNLLTVWGLDNFLHFSLTGEVGSLLAQAQA